MEKPRYIAIAAITADGKIARNKEHMSDWTSKEDKDFMRAKLKECDAIIVGNNTYKTAIKPLSKRNCVVFTRSVQEPKQENENCCYINPEITDAKAYAEEKGYKTIAILGGAATYNYCLAHDMTDELYLTIEPIIFGEGIDIFTTGDEDVHLTLQSSKQLNKKGAVLLHYTVDRP